MSNAVQQTFAGVPLVAQAEIHTPIGPMTALATEQGLAGLWFDAQTHHPGEMNVPVDASNPYVLAAHHWLDAYWSGRDTEAIHVPLDLHGTPFQRAVWKALCGIGKGRTRTYGEIRRRSWPRCRGAGHGRSDRAQSGWCDRAVPPRDRGQWLVDRLRRRAATQDPPLAARRGAADVKARDLFELLALAALWGGRFCSCASARPTLGRWRCRPCV